MTRHDPGGAVTYHMSYQSTDDWSRSNVMGPRSWNIFKTFCPMDTPVCRVERERFDACGCHGFHRLA